MTFDPLALPPLITADLPGIGGQIKQSPEDFEVEEIPAYRPSGEGDFLYLWIEKRDMGAEYFLREIARRLDLRPGDIGTAGLKDRHAVTRQMVSAPATAEPRLSQLEGDGIRLLDRGRHTNKLKPGHLHGNRFRILVRAVHPEAEQRLPALLDRLRQVGLPNYYGPQRFGRDGETVHLGLALLKRNAAAVRNPFLRKLALSAAQSALFNHYLARRLSDGLLARVLPGDVMARWPFGGLFVAQDVATEQTRFDRREIVSAGPMFGRKMFAASALAAQREALVLQEASLDVHAFHGFGKLLAGTRRHNVIYLDDLHGTLEPDGVRLSVTMPAGSYATVLLREITRSDDLDTESAT
jgi:tRNA pseudouridine13 synthase